MGVIFDRGAGRNFTRWTNDEVWEGFYSEWMYRALDKQAWGGRVPSVASLASFLPFLNRYCRCYNIATVPPALMI